MLFKRMFFKRKSSKVAAATVERAAPVVEPKTPAVEPAAPPPKPAIDAVGKLDVRALGRALWRRKRADHHSDPHRRRAGPGSRSR